MKKRNERFYKRVVGSILAIVMTIIPIQAPIMADEEKEIVNLVQNGDFEEDKNHWEDWGETEIIEDSVANGLKAIKLGGPGIETGMGQEIEGWNQNKKFELSGFGKVDVAGEVAILKVECKNGEGERIKQYVLEFTMIEYEQKSLEFTIPDGTDILYLVLYKNEGEGAAYLDGIVLKDVKEESSPKNNFVKNGNFEEEYENKDNKESAFITGWDKDLDVDSGASNIGQTKIAPLDGIDNTNALRIGVGEGGRGQIIENITGDMEFTISGWGKVSEEGETGYLGIDCMNSEGKKIAKFGVEFTTTDYVEKSRTFKTVQGTTQLQIYTYKNPSADGKETYAYFDNISLLEQETIPEEVLLKNGSFEEDKDYWDDWGNADVVEDAAKGVKAIRLGADGGMGQIIEELGQGKVFELSGFGKVEVAGEAAILGIDCFDGVNPKPFKKFGIEFKDTKYEQKSLKFTIPDQTVMLQIYIYKDPGEGYAYVDGIELKRANEELSGAGVITARKPAKYDVFFDDFTTGLDASKWLIGKAQWGGVGVNGGVIPENVAVKDGMVEITGRGDLYEGEIKGLKKDSSGKLQQSDNGKRTGGVIVTKDFYGSGRYEVRAKVLPQLGACSAFWTFFNDGVRNHEIDIEVPGEQNGIKAINKVMTTTWVVEEYNTSSVVDTPTLFGTEEGITDGDWHTYRFDWHTDPTDPRVDFYIDDVHVYTSKDNIPFAAGRFWLGVWFPNNWAGVPNFDTDRMLIDWVKITPFYEEGDQWLKNYDSTWADLTEYPSMTEASNKEPVNKHNFAYMHISEMNEKRRFTEESIKDFVQQLEDFAIEYQFCDVGFFDADGKMPQSEVETALTHQWITTSRQYKPNQKIIATINGSLWEHVIKSEEIRQSIAGECAKLIAEFKFDGIQVDMEPFRKEYNDELIDLLQKIRKAIGEDKHLSIATTALEAYIPHEAIVEIANIVDMINPMLYDSNGPEPTDIDTDEKFIEFWRYNVLRYSKAIAESNNKDCQLSPTMPVYDTKGYSASPGWPDPDSGMVLYHIPEIENIKNAIIGLRQAISEGANVYGSGIFWWGCFTSVQYDERDGQDYAKDRTWWMEEWVNYDGQSETQRLGKLLDIANKTIASLRKTIERLEAEIASLRNGIRTKPPVVEETLFMPILSLDKTVYLGSSYEIQVANKNKGIISFTSEDETIANVSTDGTIKPISVGNTKIIGTINSNGKVYAIHINVSIKENGKTSNLKKDVVQSTDGEPTIVMYKLVKKGASMKLAVKSDVNDMTVNYISSDTRVVTVDSMGNIYGKQKGDAIVTALVAYKNNLYTYITKVRVTDGTKDSVRWNYLKK